MAKQLKELKKVFYILFFITSCLTVRGQYSNNIWCFGDSAGINFSDTGNLITITSAIRSRGTCVSIADDDDSLLFSANTRANMSGNTTLVWSNNNMLMQNGNNIIGRGWYHELVIVPFPESDSLFYLFSIGVTSIYGLYYSVIDISQNGGLGSVTQANIQLQSFPVTDCLAAIKHGNGRDWRLVFRKYDPFNATLNDEFYSYLLTPTGIDSVIVQHVGSLNVGGGGNISFSTAGNKMSYITWQGLIEIYDYDRCTGIINNPITIEPDLPGGSQFPYYMCCAFSQNGNVLYVTSYQTPYNLPSYLYQFDLTAPNIGASKQTIYTFPQPIGLGHLKLAPDNKIYLSCMYECPTVACYPYPDSVYNNVNMNLSVINQPDSLGAACNFTPFSFYLGGHRTYYGLPNNPDYELGALTGSICDSLTGMQTLTAHNSELNIFPNPFYNKIAFQYQQANKLKIQNITVLNQVGEKVFEQKVTGKIHEVDLSFLKQGVYFISVKTEKNVFTKKIVKL